MVAVGMRPRSDLVAAHAELDAAGAVVVGADLAASAPGLYAAGDVRTGAAWRCAAAWGDGLTAARSVMRSAVAGRG
jgi:thioredoxin reductase (NADPH)